MCVNEGQERVLVSTECARNNTKPTEGCIVDAVPISHHFFSFAQPTSLCCWHAMVLCPVLTKTLSCTHQDSVMDLPTHFLRMPVACTECQWSITCRWLAWYVNVRIDCQWPTQNVACGCWWLGEFKVAVFEVLGCRNPGNWCFDGWKFCRQTPVTPSRNAPGFNSYGAWSSRIFCSACAATNVVKLL